MQGVCCITENFIARHNVANAGLTWLVWGPASMPVYIMDFALHVYTIKYAKHLLSFASVQPTSEM